MPLWVESTRHKHMQPISYAFPKLEHARFEFQHHFSLFVVIIQNACFSVSCSRNVYFKGSLHPKPNSLAFVCAQHSLRSLSSWADFDSWRFGNNFKMGKIPLKYRTFPTHSSAKVHLKCWTLMIKKNYQKLRVRNRLSITVESWIVFSANRKGKFIGSEADY